jgi:hypothetical protein
MSHTLSYATSYTMSYTISYTLYVHLLSRVLSGGLFHWKKGLAYSVVNEGLQLYHNVPENTLLNDVFFYVMYHLSSFQSMHEYQVTKDTEIFEFVHTSTPAIPGSCVPETHRISKQLVAYLETRVAFNPFNLTADPRTQGKIENFYRKALDRYKDFTYKEFHNSIPANSDAQKVPSLRRWRFEMKLSPQVHRKEDGSVLQTPRFPQNQSGQRGA